MTDLILASQSKSRAALLEGAGLKFQAIASHLDESLLKEQGEIEQWSVEKTALSLGREKALSVSKNHKDAYVIGADQMLACEGTLYDKPNSISEAKEHLKTLRGKTHQLVSAVCVVQNDTQTWSICKKADLTMRDFSDDFLEDYLNHMGSEVCRTVGCYQLEGPGVQLFEDIKGDYFTILGLPLVELLSYLRGLPCSFNKLGKTVL